MRARPRAKALLRAIVRDVRGTSAVEFALVAFPFILMLLMILQMGIFYMAQSALDAGVIKTADSLVNTFYSCTPIAGSTACTAATVPSEAQLKAMVLANAGGLIQNNSYFDVELRLLSNLSGSVTPIGNTEDSPIPINTPVALRAQASIPVFMPGLSSILPSGAVVRSTAIARRQNF